VQRQLGADGAEAASARQTERWSFAELDMVSESARTGDVTPPTGRLGCSAPPEQAGSAFWLNCKSANVIMRAHMKPRSIHTAETFGTPWRGLFGTRIESDRHFVKHSHGTFGLGLIERGAQSSASGRGQVEAHAGDVIACNPGEVHDGHPIGGPSRLWRMVYAEPEVFAALTGTASVVDASRVELTRPVTSDARLTRAVRTLFGALDDWQA